jgi:phosphoenolpyruvate-protein phosphotransferase
MKELDIVIQNPTGLHARPAKIFVKTAKQFKSDIRVQHGEKKANAKSLISMLTLGVETNSEIRIIVDGVDEDEALQTLETAVREGLGEAEHIAQTAAAKSGPKPAAPPPAAEPKSLENNHIQGIAAAPGIAIGPVYQFQQSELEIEETFAGSSQEQTRLQEAIERARGQLVTMRKQMLKRKADAEAAIFDVHLEILDDPDLLDTVLLKINEKQNAAQAWQETIDQRAELVAGLDDPLLAARSADLHDVGYRVLRLLVGSEEPRYRLPDHPVIILAEDLSPSDTASLDKGKVLGFCTAIGGPTAHSAIIARALSLPAVVSAGENVLEIADGTMVIVDGGTGLISIAPDEATINHAQQAQAQLVAQRDAAEKSAAEPAITQDGHRVEIVANIGGLADAELAMDSGAEGVGLLRTEFLFLDRTTPPTEDEQFSVYRNVAQAMQGQPVIIRTLDIGGDKPLPYIDVPPEANPFLGERGIRLCLNRPELLREQLRAILRASQFGKLRIMFPMIADLTRVSPGAEDG